MSKTERELKQEFEADYKVEPSFHVTSDGHIEPPYLIDDKGNKTPLVKQMGVRSHNIGTSDYSTKKIQPWDIWVEYQLNPWDADIVKRVLRTKKGEDRTLDYQKIIHICQERIRQLTDQ